MYILNGIATSFLFYDIRIAVHKGARNFLLKYFLDFFVIVNNEVKYASEVRGKNSVGGI